MTSETDTINIRSTFFKWIPIISTLLLTGVTYGVQRTALSLYAEFLATDQVGAQFTDFLVFIQAASTIIAYGLFKGISGFLSAKVSGRFKRKNTMRIGLVLLLIGSVAIAFATYLGLWALIIGNLFIGGGLGLFFTSSMSALSDIAGAEGSAFSVGSMEFSVYLGSSLGAFFAGLIAKEPENFAGSFIFALAVAGVAVALGFLLIRKVETSELVKGTKEEILLDSTKVESRWSFRNVFKTPTLLLSYFAGHFSRIMDSIIVLLLPVLVSTIYGFKTWEVGLVTSGFTLAWALSMPFTGRISDRFGRKETIFTGLAIEGVALILITLTHSTVYVILLSIVAGIGTAIYYPSLPSISRDIVPIVKREQSLGIYRASLDSGYVTGPLLAIGLAYAATSLNLWNYADTAETQIMENMLKFPFLVFGGVLCLLSILFIFFAKETRPGWVQASQSIKHGYKVLEVFQRLSRAFTYYITDANVKKVMEIIDEAKDLEREADILVEELTKALYANIRPAPDDYHFYKITDVLDTSIGHTLRSLRKIVMIPKDKLPKDFIKYLKEECKLLVKMITKAVEALEVVCIKPLASHPIFDAVGTIENALDKNSQKGLTSIIKDSGKLNTVETLYVIQIIEALEISANQIEDAVDVMKILGLKHQISPLVI
ncbi:MAG: MFS transporter [Candidatus Heimdallarchaeota archaeon]|nr:MFS transporter [Candidatus Heimdallarchaeota archaeon]MCK4769262.1 MFS transporter [Candidatus Heimdallarchaeota archaeon]